MSKKRKLLDDEDIMDDNIEEKNIINKKVKKDKKKKKIKRKRKRNLKNQKKKSKKDKNIISSDDDNDSDDNKNKMSLMNIKNNAKNDLLNNKNDIKSEEIKINEDINPNARCFLGNLWLKITEKALNDFFKDCGKIVHIEWLTDKTTGRFYGSAFAEFDSQLAAQNACKLAGQECCGRPIKVRVSSPKNGSSGRGLSKANIFTNKPLSEKPDGCRKIFMGNLSFDIDEDTIHDFFKDCGEILSIRWLSHRDTNEFKGCGFATFATEEAVDKAVELNGYRLMGRNIRIDYSD